MTHTQVLLSELSQSDQRERYRDAFDGSKVEWGDSCRPGDDIHAMLIKRGTL